MGSPDPEVGGYKTHGDKVCTISCTASCELLQQLFLVGTISCKFVYCTPHEPLSLSHELIAQVQGLYSH
jgi:hypothetical protein